MNDAFTTVLIEPIGLSVELAAGRPLMDAVLKVTTDFPNVCGGKATCGKCLVRIGAGMLNPPTSQELAKLTAGQLDDGWRLACQAVPASERVTVEVRETRGRRRILTASQLQTGRASPAVRRQSLHLAEASFDDPRPDRDRLLAAAGAEEAPLAVLAELPALLRDNGWSVTATTYGDAVIDVEAPDGGFAADAQSGSPAGAASGSAAGAASGSAAYGVAVDVGTSKIVAYLCELEHGRLVDHEAIENPQMRYGEEVVSRISLAIQEGPSELTRAVREGIEQAVAALIARQQVPARHVYDMTVVCNTAMHHLALGLAANGLGSAPFAPALARPVQLRGRDFSAAMNPEGGVHFLPPIAGFVGSDALAVIAATRLSSRRKPAMAIDIGTNTEIALAVNGRVTVTSCASGPAFEGYQIRHGMKAVAGAIERVSFGPDGLPRTVTTIDDAEPVGICGSGVVDVLAGLLRGGAVDPSGRVQQDHAGVRQGHEGLEYRIAAGANGDIVFTQHDVRQLQLARGAISTGWAMLLERAGLSAADLRHVFVAGAFGNYLDLDNSLALDLFPPVRRDRVVFVGNAAGVGAQMALIDVRARERMAALRRRIGFLDLATDPRFHTEFASRLRFSVS